MPKEMICNLGSGNAGRRANRINVDRLPYSSVDVVHDLNVTPWPLEDNCCSRIVAKHLLEHLNDACAFMDECWRILRPGGTLHIEVPDAHDIKLSWSDPTHVRAYTVQTFNYFTAEGLAKRAYCLHAWRILARRSDGSVIVVDLAPEGK